MSSTADYCIENIFYKLKYSDKKQEEYIQYVTPFSAVLKSGNNIDIELQLPMEYFNVRQNSFYLRPDEVLKCRKYNMSPQRQWAVRLYQVAKNRNEGKDSDEITQQDYQKAMLKWKNSTSINSIYPFSSSIGVTSGFGTPDTAAPTAVRNNTLFPLRSIYTSPPRRNEKHAPNDSVSLGNPWTVSEKGLQLYRSSHDNKHHYNAINMSLWHSDRIFCGQDDDDNLVVSGEFSMTTRNVSLFTPTRKARNTTRGCLVVIKGRKPLYKKDGVSYYSIKDLHSHDTSSKYDHSKHKIAMYSCEFSHKFPICESIVKDIMVTVQYMIDTESTDIIPILDIHYLKTRHVFIDFH